VDNFTLNGTELDLSSGDFALDVAGDIEINADGGCINFKDASLALAAIVNTSCVGELRIHEAANFVGFKTPALTGDTTYTLPAAYAACNGMALTSTTGGVMSWAAAGGSKIDIIGTAVASCSGSLEITGLSSTYDTYFISWSDLVPVTDADNLYFRVGDSSGVDSGGCDYEFVMQRLVSSATTYAASASTGASSIRVGSGTGNAAGEGISGYAYLARPGDGTTFPMIQGQSTAESGTPELAANPFYGARKAVITLDRVNIYFSGGDVKTGRFTVWGLKHA
jgi:hypothetical protein